MLLVIIYVRKNGVSNNIKMELMPVCYNKAFEVLLLTVKLFYSYQGFVSVLQ